MRDGTQADFDSFPNAVIHTEMAFCSGHARTNQGNTHYPYDDNWDQDGDGGF
jgi:hypothetical protein